MGEKLRVLRQLCEYAAFRVLVLCIRILPFRCTVAMSRLLAWVFTSVLPVRWTRQQVAADNLRASFGASFSEADVQRTIRDMWIHLFRMICEMIQVPGRLRLERCRDILDFEGHERCIAAVLSGRPVMFLGGHFGNWEVTVNSFGTFGFPGTVVARQLDNPWLHRWFERYRESTGNRLVTKSGAGTAIADVLEQNGFVSMLCDQDAGPRGVFVDFFGRPASTFRSLALLALQHDALVVVGGSIRLPDSQGQRWSRFCLSTEDVIDPRDYSGADGVEQITRRYTEALERLVRRAPEQYFWVHRRWKSFPGQSKRRVRRPAADRQSG